PPEADINTPDWYTLVDGVVTVQFYANARWASAFGYTLEVGAGVEPPSFSSLQTASAVASNSALSSANRVNNFSATWSTGALANGLYTLRLRVTDNLGNTGEDRMAVWVRHPDPQDQPGFPRVFDGSLESLSVALVDLDDDNSLEIIFADGNGEVHAVRSDGTDLPGFPVHTALPRNLPLATSPAFDGNPANGEVPIAYTSVIGGVAVADLDRDGQQEIVVGAGDGQGLPVRAEGDHLERRHRGRRRRRRQRHRRRHDRVLLLAAASAGRRRLWPRLPRPRQRHDRGRLAGEAHVDQPELGATGRRG